MKNQEFQEMSLIEHFAELRKRLLWSFLYVIIIFVFCFYQCFNVKYLIQWRTIVHRTFTGGSIIDKFGTFTLTFSQTIDVNASFAPDKILKEKIIPNLESVPLNIYEICEFSIMALLANTLDHSQATKLNYKLYVSPNDLHFVLIFGPKTLY